MDDAVGGMRMQPVDASTIGRDADALGYRFFFAVHIDGQVRVDVKAHRHAGSIARNAINRRVRWVNDAIDLEIDSANNRQECDCATDRTPEEQPRTPALFASLHTCFASFTE